MDLGYSLEDQGEAGEKEKEKQRPVLLYSVTRGVVVVALFPLKYSLCSALLLVTSLSIDVVHIVRYLSRVSVAVVSRNGQTQEPFVYPELLQWQ